MAMGKIWLWLKRVDKHITLIVCQGHRLDRGRWGSFQWNALKYFRGNGRSHHSLHSKPAGKQSFQSHSWPGILAIQIRPVPLFICRNADVLCREGLWLSLSCKPEPGGYSSYRCSHPEVFQKGCLQMYPCWTPVVKAPAVSAVVGKGEKSLL